MHLFFASKSMFCVHVLNRRALLQILYHTPSPLQVAPASAPLPTTSKRASSSTMASVMTTASTATSTSLGANLSGPFESPAIAFTTTPPTQSPLLAALPAEEQDYECVENFSRPLGDVTINIDMTLYTGLRPTALVQGLHGPKRFCLRFRESGY